MAPIRSTNGEKPPNQIRAASDSASAMSGGVDLNYSIYVQLSQSSMFMTPLRGLLASQPAIQRSDPVRFKI